MAFLASDPPSLPGSMTDYIAGRVEDLPPGTSRILPVGKFGVGVFNCAGQFHALVNYCPHAGAPVCRGQVGDMAEWEGSGYVQAFRRKGQILRCPWHGWEFDLASGVAVTDPRKRVKRYPVRIEDGMIVVEVPGAVPER
jgi:nitrite reductase (NADH) small subunit